jgi:hypothetical protein
MVLATCTKTTPARNPAFLQLTKGYVSTSDTEDDLALQTNHACDLVDNDDNEQVFGSEHTAE